MPIIREPGEFIEHVHLIDLNQYGMNKITSSYLLHYNSFTFIFDCGTSDDYRKVLSYMKKHNISKQSVKFLILTHHHFDHAGGTWKLLEKLVKYSQNIKVIATRSQKKKMQESEKHLVAAASTYGDFVGKMEPISDEYFEIVEPDRKIPLDDKRIFELMLVSSPGHTTDHVSPTIFKDHQPYFSYFGEAAGTLFNEKELLTLPTSMPVEFDYNTYMQSLKKIQSMGVMNAGYCHYGAITTPKDVSTILEDQIAFVPVFREFIKTNYEKYKSTKTVVENTIKELFLKRSTFHRTENIKEEYKGISTRNALALVYGMLVDLGYKKNKY